MSAAPFLTPPDRSRRRRRNRFLLAGGLAVAIVAALVVVAVGSSHTTHGSRSTRASTSSPVHATAPAAPVLSPAGLSLGKPPLVLTGISTPQQDPVQVAFRTPPRAGLLFNLNTGQV